jgi:hypothetical protein
VRPRFLDALYDVPFIYRLLALLAFLTAVSAWDLRRRGAGARRWRESVVLLAAGVLGAAFGLLNDQVTVTISPEYFTVGKGLAPGPGLRLRAGALGLQAGFAAGVVAACILVYANNPRPGRPSLPERRLFRLAWRPAVLAAACGAVLGAAASVLRPVSLLGEFREALEAPEEIPFLVVWAIHNGVYLGLAAGIAWAVLALRALVREPSGDGGSRPG